MNVIYKTQDTVSGGYAKQLMTEAMKRWNHLTIRMSEVPIGPHPLPVRFFFLTSLFLSQNNWIYCISRCSQLVWIRENPYIETFQKSYHGWWRIMEISVCWFTPFLIENIWFQITKREQLGSATKSNSIWERLDSQLKEQTIWFSWMIPPRNAVLFFNIYECQTLLELR